MVEIELVEFNAMLIALIAGIGLEMGFFIRSGMILIIVAGGILIFAYILAKIAG